MKKPVTRYYILLLLAIMFAAPGITAYLFYQHPDWLSSSKVNKGTLLSPPIALDSFNSSNAKWRIVLRDSDECKAHCLEQLNMLAKVRLALGRKLYEVEEWLMLNEKAAPRVLELTPLLKEQDIHVTGLSAADEAKIASLTENMQIFIANPDNYLVLGYPTDVNPDDIYKDLKLLLNTTEKKSN